MPVAHDVLPNEVLKRPVIVLSVIRSGSTLLKNMLGQHPRIFAPSELHLMPFENLVEAHKQLAGTNLENGLREAIQKSLKLDEDASQKIVDGFYQQETPMMDVYNWIRAQSPAQILLDKSPSYPTNMHTLTTIEKQLHPAYIYLKRHPLDIFQSALDSSFDRLYKYLDHKRKKHFKNKVTQCITAIHPENAFACNTPLDVIERGYENIVGNIHEFLAQIPSDRFIEIAYEDLVANPDEQMNSICAFLDIDFTPRMLDPYGPESCAFETAGDPSFHEKTTIDQGRGNAWESNESLLDERFSYATIHYAREQDYEFPAVNLKSIPSPAQSLFFERFTTHNTYTLSLTIRLDKTAGSINIARLNACLNTLTNDTVSLKSYFLKDKKQWMQCVNRDSVSTNIEEIDLTRLNPPDASEQKQSHVQRLVDAIGIETAPLFRCAIFKMPDGANEVTYVFHHLVADGASLQLFHKALWDLYDGNNGKNTKAAPSYNPLAYAMEMHHLKQHLDYDALESRWKEHLNLEKIDRYFNAQLTLNTVKSQDVLCERIKPASYSSVLESLFRSAAELHDTTYPVIAIRNHGRSAPIDIRKHNLMGWFSGDVPVGWSTKSDVAPGKQIATHSQLNASTYYWLSEKQRVPSIRSICPILFNYFPVKQKYFGKDVISDIQLHQHPDACREYLIEFLARDFEDHIDIVIRYSRSLYPAATIQTFFNNFKHRLLGQPDE